MRGGVNATFSRQGGGGEKRGAKTESEHATINALKFPNLSSSFLILVHAYMDTSLMSAERTGQLEQLSALNIDPHSIR